MTQLVSKKRSLVLAIALMALIAPGAVFAQDGTDSGTDDSTSTHTTTTVETEHDDGSRHSVRERMEAAKEKASGRAAAAKARLQDAQLKRCEAKEKAITNIMARISDRGQKQLDLFTTIAGRVQNFYEEKGNTLDNYQALVADVEAKKAAAQIALTEIQSADTDFDCSGENPRAKVDGFKASLKEQIAVLKEYKTAVKNLIVGVKSVQSTQTKPADGGAE